MKNPFKESLIRFHLGYEPKWCPYMPTCRYAAEHPRCAHPYYLVCNIYKFRKTLGLRR